MRNSYLLYIIGFLFFVSFAFSFVSTDGKNILDQHGNEIIFRGIGIGGWLMPEGYMLKTQGYGSPTTIKNKIVDLLGEDGTEEFYKIYRDNYFNEKDVKQLKTWGFNSIRLPFHYNIIADIDNQINFNQDGFALLDSALAWCERSKIYLILDMHAAPGGQNHGNISDSDGEAKLWTNPENQDYTISIWKEIASRYSDKKWIAGYDLLNEPVMPNGYDNRDLRQLYIRIAEAIREVDQNHMIIIEGNWYATEFTYLTPPFDQNLVYGFHKYWSPNTTGAIQQYLTIRNNYNVPLWLGEFGENSNHWFIDIIEMVENRSIGWNWWTYKKFDSITSPLSVPLTSAYEELIKYWKNESEKPSRLLAEEALFGMAKRLNIDSCKVHFDVIDAITSFSKDNTEPRSYIKHSIPGRIESENYDLGQNNIAYFDVDIEKLHWENYDPWNRGWQYRNDGVDIGKSENDPETYYVGWTEPGEWLKYSINVDIEGEYNLEMRYASQLTSSTIELTINGNDIYERFNVESTGSWDTWQSVDFGQFDFSQGKNTIIIKIISGSINMDFISIDFVGSEQFQLKESDIFIANPFPNPSINNSTLPLILNLSTNLEIDIVNIMGNRIKNLYKGSIQPGSYLFNWDGKNEMDKLVSSGNYFFLIKNNSSVFVEKVVKIN